MRKLGGVSKEWSELIIGYRMPNGQTYWYPLEITNLCQSWTRCGDWVGAYLALLQSRQRSKSSEQKV